MFLMLRMKFLILLSFLFAEYTLHVDCNFPAPIFLFHLVNKNQHLVASSSALRYSSILLIKTLPSILFHALWISHAATSQTAFIAIWCCRRASCRCSLEMATDCASMEDFSLTIFSAWEWRRGGMDERLR